MKRSMAMLLVLALAVVACDGDEETVELTTTTTAAATSQTSGPDDEPGVTGEATDDGTETSDPGGTADAAGEPVEGYEVRVQTTSPDGDRLWVVIEPGRYTSVDLENFIVDVLDEADDPILELHVFDDVAALEAGRVEPDARTDAEQALVDEHYLVSVAEGNVVTFQGPYAAFGGFTFGS